MDSLDRITLCQMSLFRFALFASTHVLTHIRMHVYTHAYRQAQTHARVTRVRTSQTFHVNVCPAFCRGQWRDSMFDVNGISRNRPGLRRAIAADVVVDVVVVVVVVVERLCSKEVEK